MMRRAARTVVVLSMLGAAVPLAATEVPVRTTAPTAGSLVLIGGGEKPPEAMRKFVELAGGVEAPIAVVPTASSEPDTGEYYVKLFRDLGCKDVVSLEIHRPADASKPELVAAAARARGIFFGGGDQVRIATAFSGSPVLAAIRRAHAAGAVVGGTSAGTACQSPRMLTGEGDFKVVRTRAVELWEGLGFLPGVVLDQHFLARQRENRLLSVILEHPEELGVGIDEDTAIWVRPDRTFEVMGRSAVMVIDARGATVDRRESESGQDSLGVHDLRVHLLLPGEVFDLETRQVVPPVHGAEGGR